jgi:hypothetical protein
LFPPQPHSSPQSHKPISQAKAIFEVSQIIIAKLQPTKRQSQHLLHQKLYTAYHQKNKQHNPTTANMSNSIQDQNMGENKVNDTPVEAPIEKGKGKAADEGMDDDEDDSESGEVSCANTQCRDQLDSVLTGL